EAKTEDSNWFLYPAQVLAALGRVWARLFEEGKMELSDLEAKLEDNNRTVRQAAREALDRVWARFFTANSRRSGAGIVDEGRPDPALWG
ncbi:MAG: hypothetical protein R6V85_16260, partial [Polyangia bacterium]